MSVAPTEIALRRLEHGAEEWTVERIVEQTLKIKQCMQAVMKADEHYGVIPGTGSKPTLLKPGAEKLCLMFRLNPEYETERAVEEPSFILFRIKCTLRHITSGNVIATGLGSCSSREEKYGWRKASRKCPKCSKETIIKGKEEYGGGWLCFAKKGGCNAKFKDGDKAIEGQDVGKVPVENVWDQHNTLLKMACKRALIAAVLNGTAASDFFTQDLEDLAGKAAEYAPVVDVAPERPLDPDGEENRARFQSAMADEPRKGGAPTIAGTPGNRGDVPASGQAAPPPSGTKNYVPAKDVPVFSKDPLATKNQIARIHILQKEIGWPDGEVDAAKPVTTWPLYRQAIGAYRTHDGKRCLHSNELTVDQAANLIRRMEAQRGRNAERHAKMEAEVSQNLAALGGEKPTLAALSVKHFDSAPDVEAWVMSLFAKESLHDLDDIEAEAALQLLMVYGTDQYDRLLANCKALGKVRNDA